MCGFLTILSFDEFFFLIRNGKLFVRALAKIGQPNTSESNREKSVQINLASVICVFVKENLLTVAKPTPKLEIG